MSRKPVMVDLFCGLGGWAEGGLAAGYSVLGFDIERHVYGEHKYPAQLVIQDVLTLHGAQLKNADLLVASPPCQFFSYTAMPWSRAKKLAADVRANPVRLAKELALFNACFRIQREACEAAGRRIPLIVENVRGAQEWAGRARWSFGSFYLWGDVPALMPMTLNGVKVASEAGRSPTPGRGARFTSRDCGVEAAEGRKGAGAGAAWFDQNLCALSSKSPARKFASAMIAKIPPALSTHIALTFRPTTMAATG